MNVTKDNVLEAIEELEKLLPSADFVAIDEEMTGISVPGQPELVTDVPSQRYAKMRVVASKYSIIQFGVCLFHKGDAEESYVARPFNFYMFPESGPVTMEGSSIGFLRQHGMDFNKWIREGIPFVDSAAAKKLRASLLPQEAAAANGEKRTPLVLTKKADIDLTDTAFAGLSAWLEDDAKKEETEYALLTTNAYIRRFCHEKLEKEFPTLIAESRPVQGPGGGWGVSTFTVLRLSDEQKAERALKQKAEKEREYARRAGVFRVFSALVDAKRPLIGHNCMFDLLFMMRHFEGPLPESYLEFKEALTAKFPVLLDTKALTSREPFSLAPAGQSMEKEQRFGSTALGEIFKVFQEEAAAGKSGVKVSFAEGFDRYANDASAAHEAGYDAYMTGYAFAHMAKEALSPEGLTKVNGRTPIFRSLFEFNLLGEESKLHDGVYVHVTGLRGRGAGDLRGAFAEVKADGKAEEAVSIAIRWIDDDSAFAVLPESCAQSLAEMLQRARSAGGLSFTPGEEWFAARESAGVEPPAKRARTGPA